MKKFFIKTQPFVNQTRTCLPVALFYAAFDKTHSRDLSGEFFKNIFNQFYYIQPLPLLISIYFHDCIECQTNKHFPIKPKILSLFLPFYENATHFNYRITMDTEILISPSSQGNSYIFVIIDAFSHFLVTNPAPHISSKNVTPSLEN